MTTSKDNGTTNHDAARLMTDLEDYVPDEEDEKPRLRAINGEGLPSTKPQPKLRLVR